MKKIRFNRDDIRFRPLSECARQVRIADAVIRPDQAPAPLPEEAMETIRNTARDLLEAREKGASRILTFGTLLIRNGLGPLVGEFVRRGWLTHLATTGTSIADDWEFAFHGCACEDTRNSLPAGSFGLQEEPDRSISLALLVGAWQGLGMGESVARTIAEEGLTIPNPELLQRDIADTEDPNRSAAAADLLEKIEKYNLRPGRIYIQFPYREYSLQYAAWQAGIPLTVHPMFGLDVFFMHPLCSFAAVGRTAEVDFLCFTDSVCRLEDGIYLSVGSSVASPMIFEKALSMSQNVRIAAGCRMTRHKIVVVDLAESKWDWMANGEPPENRPEYYLRYCKSFSRAKARSMHYVSADNRAFFLHLYRELDRIDR